LTEDERHRIVVAIASDPTKGDLIKGTGGARKIRFSGRGKGKSSAFRVVTYFAAPDVPVFLLDIYAKEKRSTCCNLNAMS
jgi:mRNA-degrading endonuclease RelE of RelBE toxin-antitoxin system